MLVYSAKPGFGFNPLRAYRNLPCPCNSGRKVKRCHGMIDILPLEEIEKAKGYLRMLSEVGFIEARESHLSEPKRKD